MSYIFRSFSVTAVKKIVELDQDLRQVRQLQSNIDCPLFY